MYGDQIYLFIVLIDRKNFLASIVPPVTEGLK